MDDATQLNYPDIWVDILDESGGHRFDLVASARTGALLRCLAASKPGGRLLEIGTGTGAGTAWLLDGMDSSAQLLSVDLDPVGQAVAKRYLGKDPRLELREQHCLEFLEEDEGAYDLVFADSFYGKTEGLELALARLAPGGIYIGDDLLHHPAWPEGHAAKIAELLATLESDSRFAIVKIGWDTGLVIAVRLIEPAT